MIVYTYYYVIQYIVFIINARWHHDAINCIAAVYLLFLLCQELTATIVQAEIWQACAVLP